MPTPANSWCGSRLLGENQASGDRDVALKIVRGDVPEEVKKRMTDRR